MPNEFACDLCFPNAKEIGMIGEHCYLIEMDGKYHILWGQGHKGDIIHTFTHKPWQDPDPECVAPDDSELSKEAERWISEGDTEIIKTDVETGWRFINKFPDWESSDQLFFHLYYFHYD